MRPILFIAVSLLVLLACDGGSSPSQSGTILAGNLVCRDSSGDVIATADVDLPEKLPANGQSFSGTWQLRFSKPAFPARATKNGAYKLAVWGGLASIDLNPPILDNNVVLMWDARTQRMAGSWYYASFSGGKDMGTFTLGRRLKQ